jgi:hypothetical protein
MGFEFVVDEEDILPAPILASGSPATVAGGKPRGGASSSY